MLRRLRSLPSVIITQCLQERKVPDLALYPWVIRDRRGKVLTPLHETSGDTTIWKMKTTQTKWSGKMTTVMKVSTMWAFCYIYLVWCSKALVVRSSSKCNRFADWLLLSLCFNGHCPGGPALASTRMSPFWILLELRMMEMVVTTGAVRHAQLQSNCHHQQTRPDALSVVQQTMSEHWRKLLHFNLLLLFYL